MTGSTASAPAPSRLDAYAPPSGMPDELMQAPGRIRAVWQPFADLIGGMSDDDLARRIARGDQYLRDAGVFFRQFAERDTGAETAWPLSHVPVILDDGEWQGIAEGLTQRAEVLERIVADIYGNQTLVAEGMLPGEILADNPEWLRPLVGTTPRSGHFLHFLAFEIGRNPDGSWFVLGDRTQAPSGAGFALENRMATSRVFSDLYARGNIRRLAGFFRAFTAEIDALRGENGSHGAAAILTPGPGNDTYYEHVYIARYLGLMLLEGEDLVCAEDRVMVRTVEGLQPVSVLWRRLDAAFADPLELEQSSRIGCAGLVDALRGRQVSMINALGSGVVEARAMMAFIPRIAEHWLGEALKMPNIATWWCGDEKARAYVAENAERMLIGPALSGALPFARDPGMALGGRVLATGEAVSAEWLAARGGALAGQEAVTLSTTPALQDGQLVPRPMTVRVFLARTAQGWQVMPGGYARIGRSADATALSMQEGGAVADVWIAAPGPVAAETMDAVSPRFRREAQGVLPSRAADNLYWLGRYTERTEGMLRLLRSYHMRRAETGDANDPRCLLIADYLATLGADAGDAIPAPLTRAIDTATQCAGKVRDRFSLDGWTALLDISNTLRDMHGALDPGDDAARAMGVLLRKIAGFTGLVKENMYRFTGWRFLELGRALERADAMAAALSAFAAPEAPEGSFDVAVEFGDSVMVHQRRYKVQTNRNTVVDLLALDDLNPRSILFQVEWMQELVAGLPEGPEEHARAIGRHLLKINAGIDTADPDALSAAALADLRGAFSDLSQAISSAWLN